MNLMERVFLILTYFSYLLYFFIYLNVWNKAPEYLNTISNLLQLYVALLLIYFFNPFTKKMYGKFHKRLAFSSGVMLLTSVSFESLLSKINEIKNFIQNVF